MEKKRIAVVGAGIAGLTCAYELQKAGHVVEVYEREPRVGGRMSSKMKDGYIFDIGANHLINLYHEMKSYCEEFGIDWERVPYVNYRVTKDCDAIKISDALTAKDKIRLVKEYMRVKDIPTTFLDSSTLVEYDTEDADTMARRAVGDSFADYMVDTYTGVYQFHRATEISSAGLMSQLNSIKQQNAEWYLHRTKGGMIALPEAFADRLTVHIETPVTRVENTEDGKVEVEAGGNTKTFDTVVMASTATVTKKIFATPTENQNKALDAAKYAPSIVVAFTVDKNIMGPADTGSDTPSAVWIPYSESKVLSSYCNEVYKGEEFVQGEKSIFLTFFREDGYHEHADKSDEEIYEIAKKELTRLCPWIASENVLESHDVHRWDEAMPKFYHGSLKIMKDFLDNGQGDNNVWFCGDFLNSPWTEGALRCGQRVAEAINEQSS